MATTMNAIPFDIAGGRNLNSVPKQLSLYYG